MKRVIEILVLIFILVSCLLTGNPIVKNDMIINIVATIIGIIFCIYMLIKRKKFCIDKQGIGMLILCISPVIPLIFKSYISLTGTIYYIFRYISILVIYFIISYLINHDEKIKYHMKIALICSGIIFTIFGIDLMTTGLTKDLVNNFIGQKNNQELETRMFSLFLYSNTFAISVIVSYILSIGESLKENFKIPFLSVLNLLLPAILLTQSRICVILLAVGLMVYFICMNTQNKYKFIKILIINGIFSLLYVVVFNYLRQNGYMALVWILSICIAIIPAILTKYLIKYEKINKFITIKNIIIILVVMVVILLILTCFKSPLVLFSGSDSATKIEKEIWNIEPKQNYEIKLNLEAISNTENNNYKIIFSQLNKYSDEIKRDEVMINKCKGEFALNIQTSENIELLLFSVEAIEINENTKVIINSLKLNDEEIVLNYKFLPTDIINRLKNLELSQKSVWERVAFIKDGFNIIGENILLGIGGDCWRYKQFENQTYYYNALEMHCYILQVFMEYGIIGFVALIFVLVTTFMNIIKLIKEKKDVDLSIGIAFIVLLGHTLLDFDMTFMVIMVEFYILIAMLNTNVKSYNVHNLLKTTGLVLIIISCLISCYFNICEIYVKKTAEQRLANARSYEEKTDLENLYIKLVPYKEQYRLERIQYLDLYLSVKSNELKEEQILEIRKEQVKLLKQCINMEKKKTNMISEYIQLLMISENKDDKEYAYKKIEESFLKHRYFTNQTLNNYMSVYGLIYGNWYWYTNDPVSDFEKYGELEVSSVYDKERLLKIIADNMEKDIKYIKDYEKCRISKQQADEIIYKIQGVNK